MDYDISNLGHWGKTNGLQYDQGAIAVKQMAIVILGDI